MNWRRGNLVVAVMTLLLGPAALGQESKEKDAMQKWRDYGNEKPTYTVKAAAQPELQGLWDGPAWKQAETLEVAHFFPVGEFRPVTQARVLHGKDGLYIHFRVQDQYVLSTRTEYHGEVWKDACAEFFVQPKADRGYFNFEINAGGTMLISYH
ncbi:MAG: carbohydrate-binding family 9-like protein, partial [Candidatus Hydrogenedentes bacterium]|nr:carbohydrate-binding family 9-like protein [Candidatus Hydrogenedentota bacterium]